MGSSYQPHSDSQGSTYHRPRHILIRVDHYHRFQRTQVAQSGSDRAYENCRNNAPNRYLDDLRVVDANGPRASSVTEVQKEPFKSLR